MGLGDMTVLSLECTCDKEKGVSLDTVEELDDDNLDQREDLVERLSAGSLE